MGVSPWFSDYRDNPNNYIIIGSALDYPTGYSAIYSDVIVGQPRRSAEYTILRALDSPPYDDNMCAWVHARWGEFAGFTPWAGVCPPTISGLVDGAGLGGAPFYNSNAGSSGGQAEEVVVGHGVWVHRVYERIPTFGVLGFPDPEAMGYPADAELEIEGDVTKPDLAKIEFAGDDGDPRPGSGSGAQPVELDWRDTHDPDPPPAIVPTAFNAATGLYDQWPKGNTLGHYTYVDGPPDWQLIADAPTWDYFNFPTADEYVPADFVFGSRATHDDPANGTGGRPGYTVAVKFTFRAPRYRWITPGGSIPPRRIRQRGDGLTGGARGIKTGARTRQAGNRTIGGIL